ncbi:MAG TPA: DUF4270 domain-containing protein [Bacteroidetes bacterium]|nr:DUF4270 domain-containing protein [Bacteroidota bacterium]
MMLNKFFRPVSPVLFGGMIIFLLFARCEKEPGTIGLTIQPDADRPLLAYFDTMTVEAYTLSVDSVRSDENLYSLVGEMVDPVFGAVEASFMTQIVLSGLYFYPGVNPELDSAVIYLKVNERYGMGETEYQLNIRELIQPIDIDSTYYSNMDPTPYLSGYLVGTTTFSSTDTVIQCTLNPLIGNKLIEDSLALSSQSNFREHFYGFHISAEKLSGNGALVAFDLLSEESRVDVYYSNASADSLNNSFLINSSSARINIYRKDLSQADPLLRIQHIGTGFKDSVCYVQGLAGVETYLHFPFQENWTDRIPGAVNKVTLTLPVENHDPTATVLEPASRLIALYRAEDNRLLYLPDKGLGEEYFGGYYDKQRKEYVFNITDFYKDFLLGNRDHIDMYIRANEYTTTPHRVVLTSGNNSRPVTLKVYYTGF